MINELPLPVVEGQAILHNERKLVFRGRVGDCLHFVDEDEKVFLVQDEELGGESMPGVAWFLQEFVSSKILFPTKRDPRGDRFERLRRLDTAAAVTRDPKSLIKYLWAEKASHYRVGQNEEVAKQFVAEHECPEIPAIELGIARDKPSPLLDQLMALSKVKPSGRTLMRWIATYERYGKAIGAFVNKSGRPVGHSQLPPKADLLVQRATDLFYERPEDFPTKEDAGAQVKRWWDILKADDVKGIGAEAPTFETVRKRINANDNYENCVKREGRMVANKRFVANGEPLEVTRPFERVYMDGTEYEHATTYSDQWAELAGKMKGVCAMDVFSLFKWPHALFCGPYRPEMSIRALLAVMTPRVTSAEDIEADPLGLIYGIPSLIMYDNDFAMLPPTLVPSLATIAITELAAAYHHNAKNHLEASFRFEKKRLREIKGRILVPRHKRDIRIDPLKQADMTRAQYADRIEEARLLWNRTPKKCLNDRSPDDLMLEYLRKVGVGR
ncbi:hypothetical protein ACSMXM_05005 [Pacificimonas sp. ICDLI1SI03]